MYKWNCKSTKNKWRHGKLVLMWPNKKVNIKMAKVEETPINRKHRWFPLDFSKNKNRVIPSFYDAFDNAQNEMFLRCLLYRRMLNMTACECDRHQKMCCSPNNICVPRIYFYIYSILPMWMYISQVFGPQLISLWSLKSKDKLFPRRIFPLIRRHRTHTWTQPWCCVTSSSSVMKTNVWVRESLVLFRCMWSWAIISSY